MSERNNPGFGKFIPGFDFLQNLAKGASQSMPQMATLSNWVAPTLNVEELDKRIGELKAVRFWLEQNSTALAATIQALEVQKMTLATLKGMNFSMGDVADAMKLKTPAQMFGAPGLKEAAPAEAPPAEKSSSNAKSTARKSAADKQAPTAQVVDPLQWWGALTQQFQEIATNAMQEASAAGTAMAKPTANPKSAASRKAGAARKSPAPAKRTRSKAAGR